MENSNKQQQQQKEGKWWEKYFKKPEFQEDPELQRKIREMEIEEIIKNSEPFWLTKAFVEKPFLVLAICCIVFAICLILTMTQGLIELSDSHNRDFLIWSNERTQTYDLFEQMKEDYQKSQINSIIPVRSISMDRWFTFLILTCDECTDNILTPDNFKSLYQAEQKYKSHKDYGKFCVATTSSTDCAGDSFFSPTVMFTNPNEITQADVNQFLDDITDDDDQFLAFKGYFSKEFSRTNKKSFLIRSFFKFGSPLDIDGIRYKDIFDREDDQKKKFEDFSTDLIDIVRNDMDGQIPKNSRMLSFSNIINSLEMNRVANTDMLWAFGSIIFVYAYLSLHLHSIFMGSMCILSILFSFAITLVITRLTFGIDYFSSFNILVIFIVLGIAADDIFVYIDAWEQSGNVSAIKDDYNKRMATTFRRASKAMVATSSTTGAAFLATGISPIMPISSFGFFAGFLIPINFVLVITFFPCILMIFELYTKTMCTSFNCKFAKNMKKDSKKTGENYQEDKKKEQQQKDVEQGSEMHLKKPENDQAGQASAAAAAGPKKSSEEENEEHKVRKVDQFFATTFNDTVYQFRFLIMLVTAVWFAIAIWRTTQLPALSEPEKFLPDSFDTQLASNLIVNDFHSSGDTDNGVKVYQFFGGKEVDREGVGKWDASDLGKVVWDNTFDLSPVANQQYLYDHCESMKTDSMVQDGLVDCFITNFKTWVESEGITFPVQNNFNQVLKRYTQEDTDHGIGEANENKIGFFGDDLRYVYVEFVADAIPFQPYSIMNPIYEKWDRWVKNFNANAPAGINKSQQTALINWVFMITEKEFVNGALQGTGISLAVAFAVLLLTTHNIVMSLYSILCISGIVLSVIGVMEMSGWELGVAESIAIVILIGMSVDYVVHLANHYVESIYHERYRKMRISLQELGISIISGASTTIGAGLFLFFATMIVFNKFAILITSTILFSLYFALVFFPAFIHQFGPEGNCGNILVLFKKKGAQVNNSKAGSSTQEKVKQDFPENEQQKQQNDQDKEAQQKQQQEQQEQQQ